MRSVIADAGPVIHLAEADTLIALAVLGPVSVPQAVADEIGCVLAMDRWRRFIRTIALDDKQLRCAQLICCSAGLHRGEAEALALAGTMNSPILLTDDAAARLYASHHGIEARGSLGLVLAAVAMRVLSREEGAESLRRLRSSSLWISSAIYKKALSALESIGRD